MLSKSMDSLLIKFSSLNNFNKDFHKYWDVPHVYILNHCNELNFPFTMFFLY